MDLTSRLETPDMHAMRFAARLQVSAIARQSWMGDARRDGENNSLWISAQSMWSSINMRFSQSQATREDFVVDLPDLWFIYCHASMNISSESPCQDRLALQILQAREVGALTRRNRNHNTTDTASTPDGINWTDLPYLVTDLTDFWVTNYATMSGSQRLNISAFFARLASVGVADDRLCGIALIVLRETLETARLIGELGDNENEDPSRTGDELSVSALLPSINVWLFHAGQKIVDLAVESWNDCTAQVGALGESLCKDPSAQITAEFSTQRWLYWLKRLQEIPGKTGSAGGHASRVTQNMLLTVDQRDTILKEEVETARDLIVRKAPMQMLGRDPH